MSAEQACTFSVATNTFGVPVSLVQEVIRSLEITPVPLAPVAVSGMLNLRGQIVTAIDLRTRLKFDARPEAKSPMHVVVRTPDGPISLLVDDVGEVIEMDTERISEPPETMDAGAREMVTGVYQLPERLLLVLDVARAADLSKAQSAPGGQRA